MNVIYQSDSCCTYEVDCRRNGCVIIKSVTCSRFLLVASWVVMMRLVRLVLHLTLIINVFDIDKFCMIRSSLLAPLDYMHWFDQQQEFPYLDCNKDILFH